MVPQCLQTGPSDQRSFSSHLRAFSGDLGYHKIAACGLHPVPQTPS
jgi:hypothetical protein